MGAESLYANRQGVDTAGHNIANAQTEGFSRQRVNLTPRHPIDSRGLIMGDGAYVKSITRAHDKYVEKQLNLAHQSAGESSERYKTLQSLEIIFSPEMEANVSSRLAEFFTSLDNLSAYPEELAVRTNVKESAQNLIGSIQRVDTDLKQRRHDINSQIAGEAIDLSAKVKRLAELNVVIGGLEVGNLSEANDLRDEQERILRDLSGKLEVSYYYNNGGLLTVRGPGQSLLVDGSYSGSFGVKVDPANDGMYDLMVFDSEGRNGRNIGHKGEKGSISALFDVRDNIIGGLLEKNNSMAVAIVNHVNDIHKEGFGINQFKDSVGRNFFETSGDFKQAAMNMKLSDIIMETTDAISAAATPNAPGDNVIANKLLTLRSSLVMADGNATLDEFYAHYISELGIEVDRTAKKQEADNIILQDMKSRREAVSGVSLDEESVNLMKWQTAFAASSKVITTADEMLETVLSLKR